MPETTANAPTGTLALCMRDAASGAETPARLHLTDLDGAVVKFAGSPWWHDHAAVPGNCTIALPAGNYRYTIERGAEHVPAMGVFTVHAGRPTPIEVRVDRFVDMPARGWWPGDLHVHRPLEDIELLMRAEDLHVAPVITWWNDRNYWKDHAPPADTLGRCDGGRFYDCMGGEDERTGGAFLYYGARAPLDLTTCDKEWPSPLSILARAKQADPGLWVDIEKPFWWDVPAAIAQGLCDSIGLANNHMCRRVMYDNEAWGKPRDRARLVSPRGNGYWSQEIYYALLNCGVRIPPSAGSASGVLPNPVGYNRVYVQIDGVLTWEKWWGGLRAGRSFVTNGPMLVVRANGELPGHVFAFGGPLDIALEAEIDSCETVPYIEVIKNGAIDHTVPFDDWKRTGSLGALRFDESGWFIVRAVTDNPKTFRFASTAPFYVEIGKRTRRTSRAAAQFFLDWVRERVGGIKHGDPRKLEEILAPHRAAEKFWRKRVRDANAP